MMHCRSLLRTRRRILSGKGYPLVYRELGSHQGRSRSFSDECMKRKVYLVAGESSGDAIGAKVIEALKRKKEDGDPRAQNISFHGIGGPRMTADGNFSSLFPMTDLSVMGLVEVLPSMWRFRRRLQETIDDISKHQPDVILTIDSKGFCFRVLRALASDSQLKHSVTRMHYVAPSAWAYKHRHGKKQDGLASLVHRMFCLLPFEPCIFHQNTTSSIQRQWATFVGHPAVEEILDLYGLFNEAIGTDGLESSSKSPIELGEDALVRKYQTDTKAAQANSAMLYDIMSNGRSVLEKRVLRKRFGFKEDGLHICILVGSRENEVQKSLPVVLDAIRRIQSQQNAGLGGKIRLVIPTVSHLSKIIEDQMDMLENIEYTVVSDMSPSDRHHLFKSCDAAVAVSGTIVVETSLAGLPTLVIYRANRLTEIIARRLAAVRFVSLPNLLLGREIIPELLFQQCKEAEVSDALWKLCEQKERSAPEKEKLAVALATMIPWRDCAANEVLRPVRGSDLVAEQILECFYQS